ncbi:MAG: type 4a pilus biogenesis protein PilO [Bacteroidota bacterium]
MSVRKKYQSLLVMTAALFFYLIITEVSGRVTESIRRYEDLTEKREAFVTPGELELKKSNLISRKRELTSGLLKEAKFEERSEVGVVGCLNRVSKEAGVQIRTLTPTEVKTSGASKEFGFKLELKGSYHRIGRFINRVETGPLATRIRKLEIILDESQSSTLAVNLEGTVSLFSGGSLQ